MKYLLDMLDRTTKELSGKRIFLFMDYDGTLTPIVDVPSKAALSAEIRFLLKKFLVSPKDRLIIISGRALKDIKKLIGLKGVIYVGNHGMEIEGQGIKFTSSVPQRIKAAIENIRDDLDRKLSNIKGSFVEDKGSTLSIHYRLVRSNDVPVLKNIINKSVRPYLMQGLIKLNFGKKVFEIKPSRNSDKGKAVLWLLKNRDIRHDSKPVIPIYIGDDSTDEDAFRVLKNRGISVSVGRKRKTSATYYLNNTKEVSFALRRLLALKGK